MNRSDVFSLRLNEDERRVFAALAKQMERSTGDMVRVVVRRAALDLGVTAQTKTQQTEQAQQRAA